MEERNDIVIYKSEDGLVKIEADAVVKEILITAQSGAIVSPVRCKWEPAKYNNYFIDICH